MGAHSLDAHYLSKGVAEEVWKPVHLGLYLRKLSVILLLSVWEATEDLSLENAEIITDSPVKMKKQTINKLPTIIIFSLECNLNLIVN